MNDFNDFKFYVPGKSKSGKSEIVGVDPRNLDDCVVILAKKRKKTRHIMKKKIKSFKI